MANFVVVAGAVYFLVLGNSVVAGVLGYHIAVILILIRIAMLFTYCTKKLDAIIELLLEDDEEEMMYHPPYEVEGSNDGDF